MIMTRVTWCVGLALLLTPLAGTQGGVRLLAYSPDGGVKLTGHEGRHARLWDGATGELLHTLTGHGKAVTQVAFSPDGQMAVTACADGRLRLWDVASGDLLRLITPAGTCAAFSADGATLTTCDAEGTPVDWDWERMSPNLRIPGRHVDLRPTYERWDLWPVRQGPRGTCSAFTTTGAFEFALSRGLDRATPMSTEFLNWASNVAIGHFGDGGFFHDLLKGYEKFGIGPEADLPYAKEFDADLDPSADVKAHAEQVKAVGFEVHWIRPWSRE
ncbi:MAG TPA: hypothetical protein QGH10_01330, partial [Armatimonadota bacterium]|nr:hypothetical protein [Armatimonadota bacterium]